MEAFRIIKLSNGKESIVDADDFSRVSKYKWSLASKNYGGRTDSQNHKILLHRFILNAPIGMDVDHINGNGLDNRKSNLRICYHYQNLQNRKRSTNNTSGYKNISWEKQVNKWRVTIGFKGRKIIGKMFRKIEDAIEYRNFAIEKYFGEFGRRAE